MDQLTSLMEANPTLTTALIAISIILIANELVIALRSGFKLQPASAVRMINDRKPVIVDVRNLADYKKGHIAGAVSLPLSKIGDAKTVIGSTDQPVLVVCALGTTATSARDKLRKQGYEDVHTLRGGLSAWQAADLPLVKPAKATKGADKKSGQKAAAHSKGKSGGNKSGNTSGKTAQNQPGQADSSGASRPKRNRTPQRTSNGKTPNLSAR